MTFVKTGHTPPGTEGKSAMATCRVGRWKRSRLTKSCSSRTDVVGPQASVALIVQRRWR